MARRRKRYTPAPQVPQELQPRYQAILQVLAGTLTVSEAARQLGMSRNHFQTMMHRGLSGLLGGLTPKPPGPRAIPQREARLSEENERIRKHSEKLQGRVDTIDRLLLVASDLLKGRVQLNGRKRERRTASSPGKTRRPRGRTMTPKDAGCSKGPTSSSGSVCA